MGLNVPTPLKSEEIQIGEETFLIYDKRFEQQPCVQTGSQTFPMINIERASERNPKAPTK